MKLPCLNGTQTYSSQLWKPETSTVLIKSQTEPRAGKFLRTNVAAPCAVVGRIAACGILATQPSSVRPQWRLVRSLVFAMSWLMHHEARRAVKVPIWHKCALISGAKDDVASLNTLAMSSSRAWEPRAPGCAASGSVDGAPSLHTPTVG